MNTERHVRLFKNGRNPGNSRSRGIRSAVVESVARPSLLAVLVTLKALEEDFPAIDRLNAELVDI